MIPILFPPEEIEFVGIGLGHLTDCIFCQVTEERNGIYEAEFEYPVAGPLYSEIKNDCFILAQPNETSNSQPFRIYRSSKPINGIVTFYCEHKSYELAGNPVPAAEVKTGTPTAALNAVLNSAIIPHGYTAYSDITTLNSFSLSIVSARQAMGGVEGSILNVWGGEYEFDRDAVRLHAHRGNNSGIKVSYGKNLIDLIQDDSFDETYTGVFPFARYTPDSTDDSTEPPQEIIVMLPEQVLFSQNPCRSPRVLIQDFTEQFEQGETITIEKLRHQAQKFVDISGFDKPKVTLDIDFLHLWQTPEYVNIAPLERLSLCDTATIEFDDLIGAPVTMKVIKTVYDVLAERYMSITLGSARANFADTVNQQIGASVASLKQEMRSQSTNMTIQIAQAVNNATNLITGQNGGYVVLNPPNNPQEVLILDTPDINTAVNVWRWNSGGLGFSKNGYDGPFEMAITMDGAIVADFITAGIFNGALIQADSIQSNALSVSYKNSVTDEIAGASNSVTQAFTVADEQLRSLIQSIATALEGDITTISESISTLEILANMIQSQVSDTTVRLNTEYMTAERVNDIKKELIDNQGLLRDELEQWALTIQSNWTKVEQTATEITSTINQTGGSNRIRNSVGFAGSQYITLSSGANFTSSQDADTEQTTTSGSKIILAAGTAQFSFTAEVGKKYTVSLKYRRTTTSSGAPTFTLYNGSEIERIINAAEKLSAWSTQSHSFVALSANISAMLDSGGNTIEISDLMVCEGAEQPWSPYFDEVYGKTHTLDKNGLVLKDLASPNNSKMTATNIALYAGSALGAELSKERVMSQAGEFTQQARVGMLTLTRLNDDEYILY